MAKENTIISEKTIDKILDALKEMQEKSLQSTRELNVERDEYREAVKENKWKEEKDMVKAEFKRVCDEMKKVKPSTEEYYQLAKNLQQLKSVIGYSWD